MIERILRNINNSLSVDMIDGRVMVCWTETISDEYWNATSDPEISALHDAVIHGYQERAKQRLISLKVSDHNQIKVLEAISEILEATKEMFYDSDYLIN